jgi:hypothetical protein
VKAPTSLGDKYFVHRDSIRRHLAQIEELAALDNRSTNRDTSAGHCRDKRRSTLLGSADESGTISNASISDETSRFEKCLGCICEHATSQNDVVVRGVLGPVMGNAANARDEQHAGRQMAREVLCIVTGTARHMRCA